MRNVICTLDYPVAQTKQGKYHGFEEDGVLQFYGIRYGRAKRFALPEMEESFEGVRDARAFGYICPLMPEGMEDQAGTLHDPAREFDPMAAPFCSFEMPHRYWVMDEDCLFLNIWTKHLPKKEGEGRLRPVMLWLHGGGFCAGSAIEIASYDGHNLCDFGDVVVVSINHRLNCLGFLDLSAFGEEYRYSGIAGMADVVLALRWIHENIAAFGGDPENVTVAGQSGGGGKAMALLQMPPADGLFHKIISQSGASGGRPTKSVEEDKAYFQALGCKTAEVLGLTEENIDEIRTIPYERLSQAAARAGKELGYPEGMMLFKPSPTKDWYTGLVTHAGFRPEAKDIRVLAGTVLGEFNFMHYLGDKSSRSEEERRALLEEAFGEKTDAVLAEFRRVYPGMDELYALSVDALFRRGTVRYLDQRTAASSAPCYNYIMSFIINYRGGLAPWHCSCIPYAFRNVEMEPAHCMASRTYAPRLQDEISAAWVAFMEWGDPSTGLLEWKPYTAGDRCRMVFSEQSGMTSESDDELLALLGGEGAEI